MNQRTPYLYDALVFVGCAALLALHLLDGQAFGMIVVCMIGLRGGVHLGKRAAVYDVLSGRLRVGPSSDRPPPPSCPCGRSASAGDAPPSSEPPDVPPTSAALAIVRSVQSSRPATIAVVGGVLLLLVLIGWTDGAALAGR